MIEGDVEARNDTGIRLKGEWLNRSKFGKPIDLPDVGAHVRAEIDAKGFLKSVEVLGAATTSSTALRLAVLQAAAAFAAPRELRSGDVLRIADSWLAWLEQ